MWSETTKCEGDFQTLDLVVPVTQCNTEETAVSHNKSLDSTISHVELQIDRSSCAIGAANLVTLPVTA
jgi:hypothetical protein